MATTNSNPNGPKIVLIDGGQAIQYVELDRGSVAVYLRDGGITRRFKRVGTIRKRNATRPKKPQGWEYVPTGQRIGGGIYEDIAACKRSIERGQREEFTPAFAVAGMNPNDWRKQK